MRTIWHWKGFRDGQSLDLGDIRLIAQNFDGFFSWVFTWESLWRLDVDFLVPWHIPSLMEAPLSFILETCTYGFDHHFSWIYCCGSWSILICLLHRKLDLGICCYFITEGRGAKSYKRLCYLLHLSCLDFGVSHASLCCNMLHHQMQENNAPTHHPIIICHALSKSILFSSW